MKKMIPIGAFLCLLAALLVPGEQAKADRAQDALRGNDTRIGVTGTVVELLNVVDLRYRDASTTTQTFTIPGLLATDSVLVTANTAVSGSAYLKSAVPTANTVTLTYSADPGTTVTHCAAIYRLRRVVQY